MANRFAVASGNFNDTATWSTTAAGSPGASVPVAGDNAIANTRTVTITANATCDNITNGTTYGGTAGGSFTLSDGVTLTASIIGGTGTSSCVNYSGSTSSSIVGTVTGGGGSTALGVTHSGSGTLNVTNASPHTARAFSNTAAGTISITGNCTATGAAGSTPLISNSSNGTVTINGSITGGSGGASHGVSNTSNGSVNVTGSVTGGAVSNAFGINNTSTGTVTVNGGTVTATISNAIVSTTATVRASGSFIYSSDGTIPISAPKLVLLTTPTAAKTRYALSGSGTFVDMFTADNTGLAPAVGDVRAGVVYGSATGTLAVPAAGSVALGVAVDNTVGTAILTQAAVQTALTAQGLTTSRAANLDNLDATVSSRLAASAYSAGSAPSASDNAAAVWAAATRTLTSASGPTAVQIRQEMDSNSTRLANLDAAVSSRSTFNPANDTVARVTLTDTATTLTNAPTVPSASAIATAVWNAADKTGYSLTSAERTAIAAAVESSILNENDSSAVLNAIVGAIGNSNVDEVALVAAIRADLERNGGKLASIPTTAAPSASTVASAVRSELTEISRLDVSISSRMAASEATKLDDVKTKTDALNTDRLGQCVTTNILGTLLAQSQS